MRKIIFLSGGLLLLIGLLAGLAGCGDKAPISVDDLEAGSVIDSPLVITGEAVGGWFFEGVFPVQLLDEYNGTIASGQAKAKGEWMTEDYVEFEAELSFLTQTLDGKLILRKDNPSGLPENDAQLEIPVKFATKSAETVKKYIEEHIAEISPIEPVLGGQWHVLSVNFAENSEVFVEYEDGHILANLTAECSIENGEVKVEVTMSNDGS